MEPQNLTSVSEFILLGFTADPELQALLFGVFLSMYLVSILGNLLIMLTVSSDCHLHNPMYFFLFNLSLADIGFTSTTVPKMLMDIHIHGGVISYTGCLIQLSFFSLFACLESLILTVMAYDRFVAICHPLHYQVIMKPWLCGLLVLLSFIISILDSQLQFLMVSQLIFCSDVEIPHFFCDLPQLLKLACSDASFSNILLHFTVAIFAGIPVSLIIFSYTQIVSSILTVPSSGGKYKAFATCGSHLSVVCLFYGTGMGVYLSSAYSHSPRNTIVASVMYMLVAPTLNPFIYSLRNRDIKQALGSILRGTPSFQVG
ncbi:olfactory receptor 18-like [Choloepus didactylus]|uniref:olfactory receptor 18-like n=1 Tax=Choloepus didactylus TaxID=27675 RepID=UPI0018A007E5|nr:olfactory receptor 18-like [Choloepus didactylus]